MTAYVVAVLNPETGEPHFATFTTNLESAKKSARDHAEKGKTNGFVFEVGNAVFRVDCEGKEINV